MLATNRFAAAAAAGGGFRRAASRFRFGLHAAARSRNGGAELENALLNFR